MRFEVSGIHLCYFRGDVCIYMCVCVSVYVCMRVNTIASKRFIRLSSNLLCILQVAVLLFVLILVNKGLKVFFTGAQKRILMHYSLWNQIIRYILVSKWFLWGNNQIFYFNGNFCIFTEIFINSKIFKNLLICGYLES